MKNIFDQSVSAELIQRINKLNDKSQALWGKMTVDQMLAHCCVSYEMVYEEEKHPKPTGMMKFVIKLMAKKMVTNDKPFKHNLGTAPQFKIKTQHDFVFEKERLIQYVQKTQQLGADYFDGKEESLDTSIRALVKKETGETL